VSALAELHRAGLIVTANDDNRLTVRGPAPTVAAWRNYIREHKPQLLAELRPTRFVIEYGLAGGMGGLLIDPDGPVSAVNELHCRYGDRVDWRGLLRHFQARAVLTCAAAEREAIELIERIGKVSQ
jgi:hypothetical protein